MKLFVQYNTTIPSSAAVEKIFSTGKDILKPKSKRASLSDKNFERLVFLKGNDHHIGGFEVKMVDSYLFDNMADLL